jgi:hypothetical protein
MAGGRLLMRRLANILGLLLTLAAIAVTGKLVNALSIANHIWLVLLGVGVVAIVAAAVYRRYWGLVLLGTLGLTAAVIAAWHADARSHKLKTFAQGVQQADKVVLYEGLPHQMFETKLLKEERQTKPVQELNGYPFYQEPLALSQEDAKQLSEMLSDSSSFRFFMGEKKCGGFHPDYCVEWQRGAECYRAALCFGCHEVKVFGPGIESRNDLSPRAYEKLKRILKGYRKNRPGRPLFE